MSGEKGDGLLLQTPALDAAGGAAYFSTAPSLAEETSFA